MGSKLPAVFDAIVPSQPEAVRSGRILLRRVIIGMMCAVLLSLTGAGVASAQAETQRIVTRESVDDIAGLILTGFRATPHWRVQDRGPGDAERGRRFLDRVANHFGPRIRPISHQPKSCPSFAVLHSAAEVCRHRSHFKMADCQRSGMPGDCVRPAA
jgi:hypothetical protein